MTRLVSTALVLLSVAMSVEARADECPSNGKAAVYIGRGDVDATLHAAVVQQLRATLAERDVVLCTGEPAPSALARVEMAPAADGERVTLTLTVRDAVTDKMVEREVALDRVPEDARALLVAQAADELLRASWAELLLAGAPTPARPVPIEVTRAVQPAEAPSTPVRRQPFLEVGGGVGIERWSGGHAQIGPEISAAVFPWRRLGARARAGYRAAPAADATNGTVDASAFMVGLGPIVGLTNPGARAGIDASTEIFLTVASFDAHAHEGAIATGRTGTALYANVGLEGWFEVAKPLRVGLGVSTGAPIHTTRVVDTAATVTSLSGILLAAQLSVRGAF